MAAFPGLRFLELREAIDQQFARASEDVKSSSHQGLVVTPE